jgi:predicted glycosyltransferase/CheY-like chemotaxis protein
VEDDAKLREILATFLAERGLEVICAGSLAEARVRVESESFDGFVLDVGLPDGSGLALLEHVPPERVLVISAHPYRPAYTECGVRHFLEKPLDLDDLARAVARLFGEPWLRPAGGGEGGPRPLRPAVALYSHDTLGLGHLRRNLLIAQALAAPPLEADVLLLAGVHEAQWFATPPRVDLLTLPALHKNVEGTYWPRRLGVSLSELIRLRATIIRTALAELEPSVLIVDNVPRGAVRELEPALRMLRSSGRTRCVLGLRDIADDPDAVHREWGLAMNDDVIRECYDEIWVYGDPAVYDRIRDDQLPADVAAKARFVGYLDQAPRLDSPSARAVAELAATNTDGEGRLVLCLLGGGQDGQRLAESFALAELPPGATGMILTGPYLPPQDRQRLGRLARTRRDLRVLDFVPEPALLVQRADRVISMGGYNTVLELLSFHKRALVVPRVKPRREQLIRAELFSKREMIDMLHPDALSPRALSEWLARDPRPLRNAREEVDLKALDRLPRMLADMICSGSVRGARSSSPAHEER